MIYLNISENIRASDFKIYHRVPLDSLYILTGNDVIKLLPVGSKLYKRVNCGSCSGGDFSITIQLILKRFIVLETVIQVL